MLAILAVLVTAAECPADIGPCVGWQSSLALPPDAVALDGSRLYDYTFGSAPTDWEPRGGTWSITSRYACEPEWSFFGGHGRGLASIWNKREFLGDIAVEAYVAFKHGLPWAPDKWFYVPTDLNLNLCSRPGELASGYSFIYSGRNGSTTMIRRGEQILAATTDPRFLDPQFTDHNPLFQRDEDGRPFGQFHRHWWRLEARRTGRRLTFLIDGRVALQAEDPAPPEGGHVAIWTMGSGLVIARVRIAYQEETRRAEPALTVDEPTPLLP